MEQITCLRLYEVVVGLFVAFIGWTLFCKRHPKLGNSLLTLALGWLSVLAMTPWDTKHDHQPIPIRSSVEDPLTVSKHPHKIGSVYLELEGLKPPSNSIQPASFVSQ